MINVRRSQFAGFSSDALAERIIDANCKILVTADGVYRGAKFIPLKEIADSAIEKCKQKLVLINLPQVLFSNLNPALFLSFLSSGNII